MGAGSGAGAGDRNARDTTRATCRSSRCRRQCAARRSCSSPSKGRRSSYSRCHHTVFAWWRAKRRRGWPATRWWSARRRDSSRNRSRACRSVLAQETLDTLPVVVLSGPSFAAEVARGLPTAVLAASTDPARRGERAAEVPRPRAPALCERRRGRRGDWRRAEERHRHRRGRRRGHGARAQRDGGADHARSGGDLAAGDGRRRPPRHARRSQRPRRSRADVHRQPEPQPPRRHRARARQNAATTC